MPVRLSVTTLLIIVNVAVYGLQKLIGYKMIVWFALWPIHESPYGEGSLFRPWQLLTHGFLHDPIEPFHLLFNMFGLFMIGARIEQLLGAWRYLIYYLVCIVGAATFHLLVDTLDPQEMIPALGASGGLFGVLLAFGVAFPKEKLMIILLPIPIPAWLFVILYAACELFLGVSQTTEGIGHFAHLGGMLTGIIMMLLWRQHVRQGRALLQRG
jgi:membrane associated rhomboid family serine protease